MIAKRLLDKVMKPLNAKHGSTLSNLDVQITLHYGIPYTASVLAFDPFQRLLAIGTLDGRIKVIGGDNIEGLLVSQKKVPYKHIEFLHNQGFLVGVSKDNEIQVWNLDTRQHVHSIKWEINITAFSVIRGMHFMYVGDENGLVSVLKFGAEDEKLYILPFHIPANDLAEAAGVPFPDVQSVVGLLPQPGSSWTKVLIAYEKGLIVLWDISKNAIDAIRGYAGLQFKDDQQADSLTAPSSEVHQEEDKEICSLCWLSSNGSVLAVGYTNGDIFLYDFPSSSTKGPAVDKSSKNVAKLQLASGESRLPVIVLHWCRNDKAHSDKAGRLFIYGGDELGSEEVLTVLSIEWSSGIDTVKCISRVGLKLHGSFADMILVPNSGLSDATSTAALFVLSNPGHLSIYDGSTLSILKSEGPVPLVEPEDFPIVVPTIDPQMTMSMLCLLSMGKSSSKVLLKKDYFKRTSTPTLSGGTKWPLTGGVPTEAFTDDYAVKKIYIAGYRDGSVRIWDATHPILVLMLVLEGRLPGTQVSAPDSPVSALSFCSISMSLAIGNESGLVRLCAIKESTDGSSFHFVTETNREAHTVHAGKGTHCLAAFSVSSSTVRTLKFTSSGDKLAVGFDDGQVFMLDIAKMSIIFRTDCLSGENFPIISLIPHLMPQNIFQVSQINSLNQTSPNMTTSWEVVLILNKELYLTIVNGITGSTISSKKLHSKQDLVAVSMHVIEGCVPVSEVAADSCSSKVIGENSSENDNTNRSKPQEVDGNYSKILIDPNLLVCTVDALWLYSLKSVIEGSSEFAHKINLVKRCCWTTIQKKNENIYELILLYDTGDIEIRSLPALDTIAETSLVDILRWGFKTNMERTLTSSDDGQIALVNGCEFALISLLDNELRSPETLPSFHDKVLAAAADAAINLSADQRKRENMPAGLLGGFLRGLAGGSEAESLPDSIARCAPTQQLDELFSRVPFSNLSDIIIDDEDFELNIDDILIDDILPTEFPSLTITKAKKTDNISTDEIFLKESTSSSTPKKKKTDEEREKLFHGSTQDIKPTARSTDEIMEKYRGIEYAARAREKLVERQEKLQRLDLKSAELQDNAENFASMATELAKTMEKKKWWKI